MTAYARYPGLDWMGRQSRRVVVVGIASTLILLASRHEFAHLALSPDLDLGGVLLGIEAQAAPLGARPSVGPLYNGWPISPYLRCQSNSQGQSVPCLTSIVGAAS